MCLLDRGPQLLDALLAAGDQPEDAQRHPARPRQRHLGLAAQLGGGQLQRLVDQPDPAKILAVLPEASPTIGVEALERSGPTVETIYGADLDSTEYAIEVSYEGSYELSEDALKDGAILDTHLAAMGGWIASTLVKLGDLPLTYLEPDDDDEELGS